LTVRRRIVLAVFLVFAALACTAPANAQSAVAAAVAKPVSLPDIAIGSAKAPLTITEYASMSCPHCGAFGENVFPMLRTNFIDTGKVRFVFREFPLDPKAAAASMLARCIAQNDAEKYLDAVQTLFRLQDQLVASTKETLFFVGKMKGMSPEEVSGCVKDQAQLDRLAADQQYALKQLNVVSTPTFFLNGVKLQGSMSYEELEERLKPMLRK
jgi:protein-disulfide isomerase